LNNNTILFEIDDRTLQNSSIDSEDVTDFVQVSIFISDFIVFISILFFILILNEIKNVTYQRNKKFDHEMS